MDTRPLWIVLLSLVVGYTAISSDLKSTDSVQGVHLALAGPNSVRVTWLNPALNTLRNFHPICRFGTQASSLTQTVQGRPYSYSEGQFVETLNTAILNMSALGNPFQKIYYQCGDTAYSFGQTTSFEFMRKGPVTNQPNMGSGDGKLIAFVGDMALAMSLNTMQAVQARVSSGEVKMIVHEGDITYADSRLSTYSARYGSTWANYMHDFQGAISGAMYMTVPGNHEDDHGFAAYRNWLLMPYRESRSNSPYWYSYDYMGIHFTMFSTEHPFQNGSVQNNWIKQDLARANQNRANVPWLIVVGHQPLYCTSLIKWTRCTKEAVVKREILEPILRANLVDVYINGHNHHYERSWPVYRSQRTRTNYNNPSATVYITNGAGGGPTVNDPSFMPFQPLRAYGYATFYNGFLLMQPLANQLRFQYIKSRDGTVVDRFVITKGVAK